MTKAMIVTVGGTTAPIIKSIQETEPAFISFLASQQTADKITEIKSSVGRHFESVVTLVNDADDLLHCYHRAMEAASLVLQKGFTAQDVLVDYTGGTKNMSAAVTLATVTHGFMFSYVGGSERTKDGIGIVVNGKETVRREVNPWDFFAVEHRGKIAVLFNHNQFDAAKVLIAEARGKVSPRLVPLFELLGKHVEGFRLWDRFKHAEALAAFGENLPQPMLQLSAALEDRKFAALAERSREPIGFLKKLSKVSDGWKKPCLEMIHDLVANAERRFEEGKVDDAIMRLYRAVEMAAQERLENKYGLISDNLDVSHIRSGSLRRRLEESRGADGKVKAGQTMAFAVLADLGDDLGKRFEKNISRFKDIQTARNYSYLAHGLKSSQPKTYTSLKEFVLDLLGGPELPQFPKME